ncbi:aminoglycoside adenylyltransferase domain-containing protein, partial [Piscibacillus halophilus]|uniref:aminoglycoside adenylyltransferase domain-containing protein n=1 Tax=Piscibacillus halophilus TaxID=571933 RepID=UPI00240A7190
LLRQYYTLMEKDIISKLEAGYYGLEILPTKWHPIIQEAINIRKNVKEDVLNTSEEKLKQTPDFFIL